MLLLMSNSQSHQGLLHTFYKQPVLKAAESSSPADVAIAAMWRLGHLKSRKHTNRACQRRPVQITILVLAMTQVSGIAVGK